MFLKSSEKVLKFGGVEIWQLKVLLKLLHHDFGEYFTMTRHSFVSDNIFSFPSYFPKFSGLTCK